MAKKNHDARCHILVCGGDHCKESGAKELRSRLKDLVKEQQLKDRIKVDKCSCLGRCDRGPNVTIVPSVTLLEGMGADHAEEILKTALR